MTAPTSGPLESPEHRPDVPPRPLAQLLSGVLSGGADGSTVPDRDLGLGDVQIGGLTADSRLVAPGDLYLALPGRTRHGVDFVPDAVSAGARAVLTDAEGSLRLAGHDPGVPVLSASDPRGLMAELAATFYGQPADQLTTLAVTGTNGKTTTSFLVEAALTAAGRHPGLIGTLGYRFDGRPLATDLARTTVTTPESAEVQALLALMAQRGADSAVLEVSSHALALGRVDAITFDVAAFTNFGRDHLDFHGSLEAYFASKATLFTPERCRAAVVNVDDPYGRRIARQLSVHGVPWRGTSLGPGHRRRGEGDDPAGTGDRVDYQPHAVRHRDDGSTEVVLETPAGLLELCVGLPGEFNLHNAITAVGLLDLAGVELEAAVGGLATAQVPGRMQRVDLGPGAPAAFVDFAHTPQAVAAVLDALRDAAPAARVICVLGCGGDRDAAKRGPMGAVAAERADLLVATDDNPRTEDPAAIRQALIAGARRYARSHGGGGAELVDGGDRNAAIATALRLAGPGDVVAVLGKGHERGQEIDGTTVPFSDVEALRTAWSRRGAQDPGGRG